jgi:hypothetical protein
VPESTTHQPQLKHYQQAAWLFNNSVMPLWKQRVISADPPAADVATLAAALKNRSIPFSCHSPASGLIVFYEGKRGSRRTRNIDVGNRLEVSVSVSLVCHAPVNPSIPWIMTTSICLSTGASHYAA